MDPIGGAQSQSLAYELSGCRGPAFLRSTSSWHGMAWHKYLATTSMLVCDPTGCSVTQSLSHQLRDWNDTTPSVLLTSLFAFELVKPDHVSLKQRSEVFARNHCSARPRSSLRPWRAVAGQVTTAQCPPAKMALFSTGILPLST